MQVVIENLLAWMLIHGVILCGLALCEDFFNVDYSDLSPSNQSSARLKLFNRVACRIVALGMVAVAGYWFSTPAKLTAGIMLSVLGMSFHLQEEVRRVQQWRRSKRQSLLHRLLFWLLVLGAVLLLGAGVWELRPGSRFRF